jgi:hypothetical protein
MLWDEHRAVPLLACALLVPLFILAPPREQVENAADAMSVGRGGSFFGIADYSPRRRSCLLSTG